MRRALILALLLPACVPVTLPEAEEQCARSAASGGGGSVAVGAGLSEWQGLIDRR